MKLAAKLCLLIVGLTMAAPGFAENDPLENAIKARQGEMQLRAFNAGPLFAMAKGKIPYDAELATKLTANLKLMLDLDNGRAWVDGTDNEAYPDDTSALPDIWSTYPEIAENGKKYVSAVNDLPAVAGEGVDALKSKLGALGKACKGCHDNFREEDP